MLFLFGCKGPFTDRWSLPILFRSTETKLDFVGFRFPCAQQTFAYLQCTYSDIRVETWCQHDKFQAFYWSTVGQNPKNGSSIMKKKRLFPPLFHFIPNNVTSGRQNVGTHLGHSAWWRDLGCLKVQCLPSSSFL